jgi:hypothetical protein
MQAACTSEVTASANLEMIKFVSATAVRYETQLNEKTNRE